jgi:ABC-type proline/glycine betaine transport system substrate-binding protein
MKKTLLIFILAFSMVMALGGCGGTDTAEEVVTITATDNGWDSQMLHNEIARIIVDEGYDGYKLELSTGSSTMNWLALIAGDVDIDIESWTGNVASYPDDIANGDIVELGVLVQGSAQGLYVPRYVIEGDAERGIEAVAPDLKRVEDLKMYAEFFPDEEDADKGRIYGSIPGWMADEILYKKYEFYGLDEFYNYARLGSEATLWASLDSAYNLGEPWVGYCYEPTWVSGKLDIVLLEDVPYEAAGYLEGKTEFEKQKLKIVCSSMFQEKAPELVGFFESYKTGSALISKALAYLLETGATHEEAAVWFLTEYDYLLDEWLPAENAAKVREAIK